MITRKTPAFIIDDLQPGPSHERESAGEADSGLQDDGDIATPKGQPSTDDDRPLE